MDMYETLHPEHVEPEMDMALAVLGSIRVHADTDYGDWTAIVTAAGELWNEGAPSSLFKIDWIRSMPDAPEKLLPGVKWDGFLWFGDSSSNGRMHDLGTVTKVEAVEP